MDRFVLSKKDRSSELNDLKRALIDFKALMSEKYFVIYKIDDTIHYIFDEKGYTQVSKERDFLKLEEVLENGEYYKANYEELKRISALKKSEVINIEYDGTGFLFVTESEEPHSSLFTLTKEQDLDERFKKLVDATKTGEGTDFKPVVFNREKNELVGEGTRYPYRITFSSDINFILKVDDSESTYAIKTRLNGSIIQVLNITNFKDIYKAKTVIFIFNYPSKKEV